MLLCLIADLKAMTSWPLLSYLGIPLMLILSIRSTVWSTDLLNCSDQVYKLQGIFHDQNNGHVDTTLKPFADLRQ